MNITKISISKIWEHCKRGSQLKAIEETRTTFKMALTSWPNTLRYRNRQKLKPLLSSSLKLVSNRKKISHSISLGEPHSTSVVFFWNPQRKNGRLTAHRGFVGIYVINKPPANEGKAIALMLLDTDKENDSVTRCTGILVSPQVATTAAKCMASAKSVAYIGPFWVDRTQKLW